jgi:hypothetical protein
MSVYEDEKPRPKHPGRGWIVTGIGLLFVGVLVSGLFLATAVGTRLGNDRAETHPIETQAVVQSADSSDYVCVRYQADERTVSTCLFVGDDDGMSDGEHVRVEFNRTSPRDAIVVGNLDAPWFYVTGLSVGVVAIAVGMMALVHGLNRRNGSPSRVGWVWILLTTFAGLTTWVAFGLVGWRWRRPRWLFWPVVYLVGIVAAFALDPFTLTSRWGSNLGVVLFVAVWVGGMVHALVLRARLDRTTGAASEQPPPTDRPPPPPPPAFSNWDLGPLTR